MELKIAGYTVWIYEADGKKQKLLPVFYLPVLSKEEAEKVWSLVKTECSLVCVYIEEWNRDLSPWPAKKLWKAGEDFSGGAEKFREVFVKRILPEAEKLFSFPVTKENRALIGYSMAGLFAIYLLYYTDSFSFLGSASGSFWFENFIEYCKKTELTGKPAKLFFSLGNKEHETKHPLISQVKERTEELVSYFKSLGMETVYLEEEGGHFMDAAKRIEKGIRQYGEKRN